MRHLKDVSRNVALPSNSHFTEQIYTTQDYMNLRNLTPKCENQTRQMIIIIIGRQLINMLVHQAFPGISS